MKRHVILLLAVFVMAGCGGGDQGVDTDVSVPVSVMEITRKPIEEFITATGTVYSTQQTILKSETSGYYTLLDNPRTGRKFALGDFVREGQTVIRLIDQEYENNIKLESQKMNLDISQREFEKQKSLYDKGGVTLRELNNAELTYINAKYAYENALLQLAKMKISSPFDGVIVDLPYYTQNTRVASGSTMMEVMNYGTLYMEVNLPGKEMDRIKAGQKVRAMNYSLPDDTLEGSVTQVSPAIDPDTRTFKTMMVLKNPDWLLRPGMFVRADIVVAQNDTALVIPKEIILSKQRGKTVFVVDRGTAQERVIVTGLENPEEVEVIRGLAVNDRLIIKGFETLQDRSKVQVMR